MCSFTSTRKDEILTEFDEDAALVYVYVIEEESEQRSQRLVLVLCTKYKSFYSLELQAINIASDLVCSGIFVLILR